MLTMLTISLEESGMFIGQVHVFLQINFVNVRISKTRENYKITICEVK